MSGRVLERSTDAGKTWERSVAKPGSIMFYATLPSDGAPITDGFGNWYRLPNEEPQ